MLKRIECSIRFLYRILSERENGLLQRNREKAVCGSDVSVNRCGKNAPESGLRSGAIVRGRFLFFMK